LYFFLTKRGDDEMFKTFHANDNHHSEAPPPQDKYGMTIPVLHLGNCLAILPTVPDNSVNLVLGDLPYGTTACAWDSLIDLAALWKELDRVLVKNGTVVMFASQPFTTALAASNLSMLKYALVWEKNRPTGFLTPRTSP
jgi:DNA modification methylase